MKKLLFLIIVFSVHSSSVIAQIQDPIVLWLKGYGGNKDDQILPQVTQTQDGGAIICFDSNSDDGTGNIDSFCSMDGYKTIFIKYNDDASIQEWSKCYSSNGDTAFSYIFPASDGGAILGGQYLSGYGWGFYLCKQDAFGNIVWSHGHSKGNDGILRGMIATNDGGFIMAGRAHYTDTNVLIHHGDLTTDDIWVLKLDSLGNKVWSVVLGGSEQENVFSVVPGPRGGCYIVGTTQSGDYDCTGYHAGGQDMYLARLDSNGSLLWHRDLGGSGIDGNWGWGISDGKNGVLIANGSSSNDGDIHHAIGGFDYWVLEVDSSGNILWENSFGGPAGDESATSICKATDGSIWINGISGTPSGEVDTIYGSGGAWVVHTDSSGNFLNGKVLGGLQYNWGQMITPLTNQLVMAGGYYTRAGALFSALDSFGNTDAFISVLTPWTNVEVPNTFTVVSDLKIYPNPASDNISVSLTTPLHDDCAILINDLIGKQIYSGTIQKDKNNITISTKDWLKGIYIVQVKCDDRFITVKKLLKE